MSLINRIADKTLSKLVGEATAKAACSPYWQTYCVRSGVCASGHAKYRRYVNVHCDTCCREYVGCC
ncbi:hypothetical protein [Stackebrandtia albiflava]|uniref:hypothetical protein n=1 Tax=Stackebrandtia albiflava TaxID=406432 RepID=UPI0011BE17C7|nr:hypothetical protein [Stackebrandtia albiflava]